MKRRALKRRGRTKKRLGLTTRLARLGGRTKGVLLVLLGVLLGVAATVAWSASRFVGRPSEAGAAVAVSWPAGLDATQAAELLVDLGLSDNTTALAFYLRASGGAACIEAGPHFLPRGVTPHELVMALCRDAGRPSVKLVVPEGMNRFALATRVRALGIADRRAFLHATEDASALHAMEITVEAAGTISAEGHLFPATYTFARNTAPAAVVRRMVQEMQRRLRRLTKAHVGNWERLQAERGFDVHQLLTLASMVEKEAMVADELPVIASVFLNRLGDRAFKYLQSDPTAMYGCLALGDSVPACRHYDGRASRAINRDRANVYSTYVTPGLPPGPICEPGEAAITAVLAPAKTDYRYFVATGKGRHKFSRDYASHLRAIEQLRKQRGR